MIWGFDANNVEATNQFHETGASPLPISIWRRGLSFPFLLDAQRTKFVLPVRDGFPREDRCTLPETDGFGEARPLQIEPAMKRPIANMAAAITSISVTRVLPFIVWRLLCGR